LDVLSRKSNEKTQQTNHTGHPDQPKSGGLNDARLFEV
jgi:hypothetical protein